MSRRHQLNRPIAIAVTRPMPTPMTGAVVALLAAGACVAHPMLGLTVVGFALWQSLAR